ncbi:MAG: DUF3048 domain-containing protein [Lachnospiraceae bacterium]|nr:DUF3048 domain-containing protein [Lachnospiraceae bacterium]
MKDFFSKVIEFIKSHLIAVIIGSGVIIAAIVCLVIFIGSGEEKKVTDNEKVIPSAAPVTNEPAVTAVPTPEPTQPVIEITPTPIPEPVEPSHEGEVISVIDGGWIKEEEAAKRPYAIMFNNIGVANPQSGIGDAKILYEALAEGGITRLMGIFEGLSEESTCKDRIGSVRSARHYFASIADEYDAIFVHFGETTYATKKIDEIKIDHLEGTYWIGDTVFYRDEEIKAPHNAFASLEGIINGIEKMNIRTDHKESFKANHFTFNDEFRDYASGSDASLVRLSYSTYMSPYFVYDAASKQYTRYQFDDVHIDKNTEVPLKFDNIIIQLVKEWNKDDNGYQDMELEDASGEGYYITGGKCVPITWKKNEKDKFMSYYDDKGEVLVINPGRTFISVFPNYRSDKLVIE